MTASVALKRISPRAVIIALACAVAVTWGCTDTQAQSYRRSITSTSIVSKLTKQPVGFFQAEAIELNLMNKEGRQKPFVLSTNATDSYYWEITAVTNSLTVYMIATGVVQVATNGHLSFDVGPAQMNLLASNYAGYIWSKQIVGGTQTYGRVLQYQNVQVLPAPDSSLYDIVGPMNCDDCVTVGALESLSNTVQALQALATTNAWGISNAITGVELIETNFNSVVTNGGIITIRLKTDYSGGAAYVSKSGDTMTGSLDMGDTNDITGVSKLHVKGELGGMNPDDLIVDSEANKRAVVDDGVIYLINSNAGQALSITVTDNGKVTLTLADYPGPGAQSTNFFVLSSPLQIKDGNGDVQVTINPNADPAVQVGGASWKEYLSGDVEQDSTNKATLGRAFVERLITEWLRPDEYPTGSPKTINIEGGASSDFFTPGGAVIIRGGTNSAGGASGPVRIYTEVSGAEVLIAEFSGGTANFYTQTYFRAVGDAVRVPGGSVLVGSGNDYVRISSNSVTLVDALGGTIFHLTPTGGVQVGDIEQSPSKTATLGIVEAASVSGDGDGLYNLSVTNALPYIVVNTNAAGEVTINLASGLYQRVTQTGSITNWVISGIQQGYENGLGLWIDTDTNSIAWAAFSPAVVWASGSTPTQNASDDERFFFSFGVTNKGRAVYQDDD